MALLTAFVSLRENKTMNTKLTIACVSYNQEKFIAQMLDGFLAQKTNFPFVALVADDASTDRTSEIISDYAARHPGVIQPLLRDTNVGTWKNAMDMLERIDTPYVALCEADDYWTDPLKLQKQIDFLEAHPDCSMCFHPVTVHWEDGSRPDEIFPTPKQRFHKTLFTAKDLLRRNFIQTNSVVYRWRFRGGWEGWGKVTRASGSQHRFPESQRLSLLSIREAIPQEILPMDHFMHLLHAETGKIGFLDAPMAVYRRGIDSLWANAKTNDPDAFFLRNGMKYLAFYQAVEKRFRVSRDKLIRETADSIILAALKKRDLPKLQEFADTHPALLERAIAAWRPDTAKKQRRKITRLTVFLAALIALLAVALLFVGVRSCG